MRTAISHLTLSENLSDTTCLSFLSTFTKILFLSQFSVDMNKNVPKSYIAQNIKTHYFFESTNLRNVIRILIQLNRDKREVLHLFV